MRRRAAAIFTVLIGLTLPSLASAQVLDPICDGVQDATLCQEDRRTGGDDPDNNSIYGPDGIIARATNVIFLAMGFAAVIIMIVAGLQYITANGDSSNINKAKDTIIYAIVGLLVALLARTLVLFVIGRL